MIESAIAIENHSAKLAELAAKRESLQQSLNEAEAYRNECVARLEPFGKIENIETEMRRLRNALDDLGAEEKEARFQEIYARYVPAQANFRSAIENALEARRRVFEVIADGREAFGLKIYDFVAQPRDDLPLHEFFVGFYIENADRALEAAAQRIPGVW